MSITAADLRIPGGYSPKKAARAYFNRLEAWLHAGETPGNDKRAVDVMMAQGYNSRGYTKAISDSYSAIYIDALYPADWQTHASLKEVIENNRAINADDLVLYLATSRDKVPWDRHLTLDDLTVLGQTEASAQVRLEVTEHNNASTSRVGELAPRYLAYSAQKNVFDVTMTHQNGSWKVTDDLRSQVS